MYKGCDSRLAACPQWLQPGSFSITGGEGKEEEEEEGSVGVDDDGVNHTVVLSQSTDKWTSNHNSSNRCFCPSCFDATLSRLELSLCCELQEAFAQLLLRKDMQRRNVEAVL